MNNNNNDNTKKEKKNKPDIGSMNLLDWFLCGSTWSIIYFVFYFNGIKLKIFDMVSSG